MTDEDFEEVITGFRKGIFCDNVRELHFDRLPICGNEWWAWLLGFYFSSGTIYHRTRENEPDCVHIRLRVYEDVIPLAMRTIRNIGGNGVINRFEWFKKPLVKDKGLGTTIRAVIQLGWPEYIVLVKMGLPTDYRQVETKGSGSRSYKPKIPMWIQSHSKYMKAFIEGYVNGSRGQSSLHPSAWWKKHNPIPVLGLYIRYSGSPEEYVKKFVLDLKAYFNKQGLIGYFRKIEDYPVEDRVQYELSFHSKKAQNWFLKNLEIARPDLRARLIIKREADKDPVLYEILREVRTPDNVVLGMIVERPRTKKEIETSLQMREEGIIASIKALLAWGIIIRKGSHYHYEPEQFKEIVLEKYLKLRHKLIRQIRKVQGSLLYGCMECDSIFTVPQEKCTCGGKIEPIERGKALSNLNLRLTATKRLTRKLTRFLG